MHIKMITLRDYSMRDVTWSFQTFSQWYAELERFCEDQNEDNNNDDCNNNIATYIVICQALRIYYLT